MKKARYYFFGIILFAIINAMFLYAFAPFIKDYAYLSNYMVVLLTLPVLIALIRRYATKGFFLFALLALFGIGIESFGVATGVLYGDFQYDDFFTGKVFGMVPWSVGFVWAALVIGVGALTETYRSDWWKRVGIATALLVGFDLVFDPLAVHMDFWSWSGGGVYYGVPVHNFIGWIIMSVLSMLIYQYLTQTWDIRTEKSSIWFSFFYLVSLFMWFTLAILHNFIGPIIFGIIVILAIFSRKVSLFYSIKMN